MTDGTGSSGPASSRRALLSWVVAGIVTAGAGCAKGSGSDGGSLEEPRQSRTSKTTGNGTPTPNRNGEGTRTTTGNSGTTTSPSVRTLALSETATSRAGVSVTVSAPAVRKVVYTIDEGTLTHSYPAGAPDSQFLVISISTDGPEVTSLRLHPLLDGQRGRSRSYRLEVDPGSAGRLAFPVRVSPVETAAIEWRPSEGERYRWSLPAETVADLGRSPRFEVTEFDVADSLERGDPFGATLAVANHGDRDGRFLAVVLPEGASSVPLVSEFTVPVPAGESVTRDLSGRPISLDPSDLTAILDWGIDRREVPVAGGG